jgi:hypothetical protein
MSRSLSAPQARPQLPPHPPLRQLAIAIIREVRLRDAPNVSLHDPSQLGLAANIEARITEYINAGLGLLDPGEATQTPTGWIRKELSVNSKATV